jgi:hypothetical protein
MRPGSGYTVLLPYCCHRGMCAARACVRRLTPDVKFTRERASASLRLTESGFSLHHHAALPLCQRMIFPKTATCFSGSWSTAAECRARAGVWRRRRPAARPHPPRILCRAMPSSLPIRVTSLTRCRNSPLGRMEMASAREPSRAGSSAHQRLPPLSRERPHRRNAPARSRPPPRPKAASRPPSPEPAANRHRRVAQRSSWWRPLHGGIFQVKRWLLGKVRHGSPT